MHISYMHAKCTIRNLVPYLSSHLSCRSSAAQMVQTYVELLLLYAKYCTYACLYRWLHFIDPIDIRTGYVFYEHLLLNMHVLWPLGNRRCLNRLERNLRVTHVTQARSQGGFEGVRTNPPCSLAKFLFNETAAAQVQSFNRAVVLLQTASCSCYKG